MLRPRIDRNVAKVPPRNREGMSRSYVDWIKTLPCFVTGLPAEDPHHLMRVQNEDGTKIIKGMGMTQADRWALPVVRYVHDAAHDAGDDEAFFAAMGFDARGTCLMLWGLRDDPERDIKARKALEKAWQSAKLKAPDLRERIAELKRKFGGQAA